MRRNFFFFTFFCFSLIFKTHADVKPEQQALIDRSRTTLEMLARDDNHNKGLASTLKRCYGVIIVPQLVRAGFIIGAEGGSGLMLKRNPNGGWVGPSFIRMIGGSVGLQIGVEQSEIVLVVMTERGFNAMMNDSFNLGADVSIAVGPIGGGRSASTTANFNTDVYAFSRSQGAFAGGSLKGSVIKPRFAWNRDYHGVASPIDILVKNAGNNKQGVETLSAVLNHLESGSFVQNGGISNVSANNTMDAVPQSSSLSSKKEDDFEIVPFSPVEAEKPLAPLKEEKPFKDVARQDAFSEVLDPAPIPEPRRTPPLTEDELESVDEILLQPIE